ncbi:hypothetical protein BH23ACT5_BH23ACT5_02050 [soil metagenome]
MRSQTPISVLAGGCAGVALAVVGVSLALALGIVPRPSLPVPVVGMGAGVGAAWAATRTLESGPFRLGASLPPAGVIALVVISGGGLGAVRISLMVGGGIAAMVGPGILRPLARPFPRQAIAAGFILIAVVLVQTVIGGGAFGHDESAYLVKAGAWVHGLPTTGWGLHRGIGQSVLAAAILPFTRAEEAYRLVAVVLALGTAGAVAWLGRTVHSNRVGIAAAAAFVAAPTFLRRGAEFLTDLPSTGILLVATILLWRWLRARRPRRSTLMWAAALAALAVYVRYQSVLTLGLLVVATVLGFWPRLREEKAAVVAAAGVAVALLVPHFVFALSATGSPWGIILETGAAGGRAYVGQGLVDYVADFPDLLAGTLGAVAIVAGVGWIGVRVVHAITQRDFADPARLAIFLGFPALGQIVALGLISHGDPRFVFYPVALLITAGAIAADEVRRRIPASLYRAGVGGFVVACIAFVGINGDRVDRNAEARGGTLQVMVEAARTVRVASLGAECGVLTGSLPQVTWYSGCPSAGFRRAEPLLAPEVGPNPYIILFDNGVRQPSGDLLAAYLAQTDGDPIVIESTGGLGDARLYLVGDG